jgi:hypothetical protein
MKDSRARDAWRARAAAFIARQDDTTEVIRRHLLAVGTRG